MFEDLNDLIYKLREDPRIIRMVQQRGYFDKRSCVWSQCYSGKDMQLSFMFVSDDDEV